MWRMNDVLQLEWTIGDRLRKAREVAGIGVAEMAELFQVDNKSINNWERDRGRRGPSDATIRRWAELTGAPYDWLVGRSEQASRVSPWRPRYRAVPDQVLPMPIAA